MTNENNLTEIDHDITRTIRVSLMLRVMDTWKIRKSDFFRTELKQNIRALRVLRDTQSLYQEKYFWTK